MTKLKQYVAVFIIFVFIGVHALAPLSVYADDTPSETPTPTIEEQTVTPTPTATPTPSIDTNNTDQNNTGGTDTSSDGSTNTGDNVATDSAELTPSITATDSATTTDSNSSTNASTSSSSGSSSSMTTGDAVTAVIGQNDVNSNSVNSQVMNQTINIFVNEQGDIDLSTPFNLAYSIISNDKNTSPVVNVALTSATNYAYLSNDIVATANTGENVSTGAQNAVIKTGNAYSIVSFLNKTNFTVVDSVVHIVTINIFGNFSGDIILPEFSNLDNCDSCGVSVDMKNKADVETNVTSDAISGDNTTVSTSGSATITTGNSHSIVNVLNMVNTNAVGVAFQQLFISIFGNWTGNFLGWNGFDPQAGGNTLSFFATGNSGNGTSLGCDCASDLEASSEATVHNNVLSQANTGGNSIYGAQNAKIETGQAYSAISFANLVNSTFLKTLGFFGFINVFGNWTGNIGGKSKILASHTYVTQEASNTSSANTEKKDEKKESGGELSVTNKNNVGAFVHPGDTVTFFVDVKNIGTGKVYGTKLRIALLYNGQDVGGPLITLGDIEAGKTVHVSTGLVLSGTTPNGLYIAQAVAGGTTGEDNTQLTANAASNFLVQGNGGGAVLGAVANPQNPHPPVSVKGATITKGSNGNDFLFVFLSLLSLSLFLTIRGVKRWKYIKAIFVKSAPFYTRLALLRSFLL